MVRRNVAHTRSVPAPLTAITPSQGMECLLINSRPAVQASFLPPKALPFPLIIYTATSGWIIIVDSSFSPCISVRMRGRCYNPSKPSRRSAGVMELTYVVSVLTMGSTLPNCSVHLVIPKRNNSHSVVWAVIGKTELLNVASVLFKRPPELFCFMQWRVGQRLSRRPSGLLPYNMQLTYIITLHVMAQHNPHGKCLRGKHRKGVFKTIMCLAHQCTSCTKLCRTTQVPPINGKAVVGKGFI